MQLSTTEHEQLYAILQQYDENPQVQRMREFIQHGDVTTYQHCKNVVLVSFWLNRRFHLGADETSLAVGAFLHDFYLSISTTGTSAAPSTACAVCSRCTASLTPALPASTRSAASPSPRRSRTSSRAICGP